uniref:Uncharacterized protein n=1 Tax=Seriola lalandi dorsalis TaxID=1841481 RepID=A0A3B4WRV2_SERLL
MDDRNATKRLQIYVRRAVNSGVTGPTSQIPGLSQSADESTPVERISGRRVGIFETDSEYVKLAKQGGHKGKRYLKCVILVSDDFRLLAEIFPYNYNYYIRDIDLQIVVNCLAPELNRLQVKCHIVLSKVRYNVHNCWQCFCFILSIVCFSHLAGLLTHDGDAEDKPKKPYNPPTWFGGDEANG